MARKKTDTETPTPATEPEPWAITLGDTEHRLTPSTLALVAIETGCRRTLYRIVNEGLEEALSIDDLAYITRALTADESALASMIIMPVRALAREQFAAAIAEAGVMYAATRLLPPLSAALRGHTTAKGERKPATVAAAVEAA